MTVLDAAAAGGQLQGGGKPGFALGLEKVLGPDLHIKSPRHQPCDGQAHGCEQETRPDHRGGTGQQRAVAVANRASAVSRRAFEPRHGRTPEAAALAAAGMAFKVKAGVMLRICKRSRAS